MEYRRGNHSKIRVAEKDTRERSYRFSSRDINIVEPWVARDVWRNGFLPTGKIWSEGFPRI